MVKIQADIPGIIYLEGFWRILNFPLKLYHIHHFGIIVVGFFKAFQCHT